MIAQTALAAFNAGAHARAAVGKAIEQHAVRGKNTLASAQEGGRFRSEEAKRNKNNVIAAMNTYIVAGNSMRSAAIKTYNDKVGTSAEGNRKIYQRDIARQK